MWKKAILFNESLSLEVISGGSHEGKGAVKVSKFLFPLSFLKWRNNKHYFHGDVTKSKQGANLQIDRGPARLPGPWDPHLTTHHPGLPPPRPPPGLLAKRAHLGPRRAQVVSTPGPSLPPSSPRPKGPLAEEPEALTLWPRPWGLAGFWVCPGASSDLEEDGLEQEAAPSAEAGCRARRGGGPGRGGATPAGPPREERRTIPGAPENREGCSHSGKEREVCDLAIPHLS